MTSSMVYNANAIYEVDRLTSYNTSFERYFYAEQKSQLSKVSKIAPSCPKTYISLKPTIHVCHLQQGLGLRANLNSVGLKRDRKGTPSRG